MSGDVVAFLAARLDEDEAAAQDDRYSMPDEGEMFCRARMLREVEAKRAILAEVVPAIQSMDEQIIWEWSGNPAEAVADAHLPLLKIMAAVYSDHPDYDPAWALTTTP